MFCVSAVLVSIYNYIHLYICGDVHLHCKQMRTVYCTQMCNCILVKTSSNCTKGGILLYINYAAISLIFKKSFLKIKSLGEQESVLNFYFSYYY